MPRRTLTLGRIDTSSAGNAGCERLGSDPPLRPATNAVRDHENLGVALSWLGKSRSGFGLPFGLRRDLVTLSSADGYSRWHADVTTPRKVGDRDGATPG